MESTAYSGFGFDPDDLPTVSGLPIAMELMLKDLLDTEEFFDNAYELGTHHAPVFSALSSLNDDWDWFIYIPDQPRVMKEQPMKIEPEEAINLLTKTTASLLLAANQEHQVDDQELKEYLDNYLESGIKTLASEQQKIDYLQN